MNEIEQIRNVGIIAHIDAGKTTTTERMLFYSGKTHRVGEVDDGTTIMDYLDEERDRGITIISAAAAFHWRDHRVNLIDTPGHIDFTAEVERALRVIDGAVIIFSGVEGVEAQSETVWHQADHYQLPRISFVNKLDRLGASFDRVLKEIHEKFGGREVPLQIPLGIEADFHGLVDLIRMEQIRFAGEEGESVKYEPIPEAETARAQSARVRMIEALADYSDKLMELYLTEKPIPVELLRNVIRQATLKCEIVPVLCGSAKRDIGVQPVMDAAIEYLPSPLDVGETTGKSPKSGESMTLPPDADAPFSGLVFKVRANPSADLYYLRTYSGTLKAGAKVYVPRLKDTVRAKRLLQIYAQHTESVDEVGPGDIVGLIGPREIATGDTLCEQHKAIVYEQMSFPEPVISMALEPKSSAERDKLDDSLELIVREDPTLDISRDDNTGQRILSGMGELHLEINVHRLADEFNLETKCGQPRVAYRETMQHPVEISTDFRKTIGEQEIFAGVTISLTPKTRKDQPFLVEDNTRSKNLSKNLLQAGLQALSDGIKTGGNYGYPLINITAGLEEIRVQGEKTTEGAVLGAVLQALDEAIQKAGTTILEPIMKLEILAPENQMGEISNDIQRRNGLILEVADLGEMKRIFCEVPLAAMFGFSKALPKLTGGRGSFSMEPCGYRPAENMPC